ncbi:hypothetical protein HDU78_010767 [Chytriomyces hyalinus]|nr:hypothetical protein HDU78_010767 [Chytriomyces hyalinus]KAJ3264477.1 hypothetical protein HDU77_008495 [Chytriomyces hyalinus]
MLSTSISAVMPSLPTLRSPTLPLDAFQGIYQNPLHGTITIFEAGTTLHFDMSSDNPDNQDLYGIIGPWHANTFAVFEVPLLGYKDYESPVMMFDFFLTPEGKTVAGFRAFLGDNATVMVFEKSV